MFIPNYISCTSVNHFFKNYFVLLLLLSKNYTLLFEYQPRTPANNTVTGLVPKLSSFFFFIKACISVRQI